MTATGASAPSAARAAVPDPALRPAARAFPERHVVRRARVFLDQGDLVLRAPDGTERRFPLGGPTGVTRAVWTGWTPDAHGNGAGAPVLDPLGVLELRDGSGRALLRLPLSLWTPEVGDGVAPAGSLPPGSDAAALLAKAGVPVEAANSGRTRPPTDTGADRPAAESHAAPVAAFGATLPTWFVAGRAAAVVLAAATLLLAPAWDAQTRTLLLVSACALLAIPLLGAAVLLRARRLDRQDPVDESVLLRPRPGGTATRRFLRTAHVRVQDGQLVLTDGIGAERWLPLSGPGAITEAVTVTGPGGPEVVELRTRDGRSRATLPWSDWFGGVDGAAELDAFSERAGLGRRQERAQSRGGARSEDGYPAAAVYRSLSGPQAREAASRRGGLPGSASVYQPLAFGTLIALGAFLGSRQSVLAGTVAALAAVLAVLPPIASRLAGRFWLDTPVQPGAPVPEER